MRRMLIAVAVTALAPAVLTAQSPMRTGAMPAWSPLARMTDLPRALPGAPSLPGLLVAPDPSIGLHWTAGNPAGLPFEMPSDWSTFSASHGSESGDYRRPLDAGEVQASHLSGGGWRRLGAGAVTGGLSVSRVRYGDGAFGNLRNPYGSSPHTSADTSGADIRELGVHLEGAGGWRVGQWAVGIALGYATSDARTDASLTPRFRRSGAAAATVGIARAFADSAAIIGVHTRVMSDAQRAVVSAPRGVTARVYPIAGLTEPIAIDFATGAYNRRIERDAYAFGLSTNVRALGSQWVLWGEAGQLTEQQTEEIRRGAPADRFEPDASSAGLAARRAFASDRGVIVANLFWKQLSGEATRAALVEEGILFDVDEQAMGGSLDVRWQSPAGWQAAFGASVEHESRVRRDVLAGIGSDVTAWTPGITMAGARAFGRLAVSLGIGAAMYMPSGTIPNPETFGPGYERLLAPELSLYLTAARMFSTAVTTRWQMESGRQLWARLDYSSAAPRPDAIVLPFSPSGRRSGWSIVFGLNPRRGVAGATPVGDEGSQQ